MYSISLKIHSSFLFPQSGLKRGMVLFQEPLLQTKILTASTPTAADRELALVEAQSDGLERAGARSKRASGVRAVLLPQIRRAMSLAESNQLHTISRGALNEKQLYENLWR